MKKFLFIILSIIAVNTLSAQNAKVIEPQGTYAFCQRDGQNLYLDYYDAASRSDRYYMSKAKPAIVFIFGGGFIRGTRDKAVYLPWFKKLTENGYKVFSIDYRLGLKNKKVSGIFSINAVEHAINLGVEDLFDATSFIVKHKDLFNIDPKNLVVSGSSAGAIISLQAEYYICNDGPYTNLLPKDFNYAGLISFSGAILSKKGKLKFKKAPCPTMMLHGTADKVVPYNQIKLLWLGFFGSKKITERYKKFHFNYYTINYLNHQHDIAEFMDYTFPAQIDFLQTNVIKGVKRDFDLYIDDPEMPVEEGAASYNDLYK